MASASQDEGLRLFVDWLDSFSSSVLLVAHNGLKFDMPVLLNVLDHAALTSEVRDIIHGFVDSLPTLKTALSNMYSHSHSLPHLHQVLFQASYEAHDALADVQALEAVVGKAETNLTCISPPLLCRLHCKDCSMSWKALNKDGR